MYAAGTSRLAELGGLGKKMKWVFALYVVGGFSISGLPLFAGFTVEAHFKMGDDGVGADNRPLDSSGNERHFKERIGDSDITVTSSGGGYANDAFYSFSGSIQGFYDLVVDSNTPNDNIGIEIWVRTDNDTQTGRVVFGTGTGANGIGIAHNGTEWVGFLINGDGVTSVGTSASTNGE